MITPRVTRLVRTAGLPAFREAMVSLACEGDPIAARDRLIIVPTHAAAAHLVRTIEKHRLDDAGALVLPVFATTAELPEQMARRSPSFSGSGDPARREVLLALACRDAAADGVHPPFAVRQGLVAEMLRFYDALHRHRKDVDTFERLALSILEPGAEHDRGAERLVRQTRFLAAAFHRFELRCRETGVADEHTFRQHAIDQAAAQPWRHVVVAVGDRSRDSYGLWAADWDLLARVPALERLDVVVTDRTLAGTFHQQIHDLLPGIEESRWDGGRLPVPVLRVPPVPPSGRATSSWTARDREEEIAGFARWVREVQRSANTVVLGEMAIVVRQPLPYVYLAREVLRSAGVPCQTFDALPLAGEPYAATLDLVISFADSNFARAASLALLRSPHLRCGRGGIRPGGRSIQALDRALSEAGYLGDLASLEQLVANWVSTDARRGTIAEALPAALAVRDAAQALQSLRKSQPVGDHLDCLIGFLRRHDEHQVVAEPLLGRHLRARSAVLAILSSLRDAYAELDSVPVAFDDVAALVRRWIEGHTFSPRSGDRGVHLVDADSARFGEFSHVQLTGLVDGEWPERPRRNVFYSPSILRELGWSSETERLDGARAAFADLLHLASDQTTVSVFALENDAVVPASTLLDELPRAGLECAVDHPELRRIFDDEALAFEPVSLDRLPDESRSRAERRLALRAAVPAHAPGHTDGHAASAYSLGALERYQDCPFKFFAADVLDLDEPPDDESTMSPRARGRFVHELFERFFAAWDAQARASGEPATITPDRVDHARTLFAGIASELLARLPEADAALERTRLFGSAISTGMIDVVLALEATRPLDVRERWLEHRFEGEFHLGAGDGRRVPIRGVADRIDLLAGNRLRVIDYKSGSAPDVKRALQVPIYALCARETLQARGEGDWSIEESAYVAFTGKRTYAAAVRGSEADRAEALADARSRLFAVLDGASRGEFPPRPHDPMICGYCAYASVCRKDYVGDE